MPTEDQKRFVAIIGPMCTGYELKAYLDERPGSVVKMLEGIFRGNRMSQQERQAIGNRLQMRLTASAQRPRNRRIPAHGGPPKETL